MNNLKNLVWTQKSFYTFSGKLFCDDDRVGCVRLGNFSRFHFILVFVDSRNRHSSEFPQIWMSKVTCWTSTPTKVAKTRLPPTYPWFRAWVSFRPSRQRHSRAFRCFLARLDTETAAHLKNHENESRQCLNYLRRASNKSAARIFCTNVAFAAQIHLSILCKLISLIWRFPEFEKQWKLNRERERDLLSASAAFQVLYRRLKKV